MDRNGRVRQRLRRGWISVHRDTLRELRERLPHDRAARLTFVELMAEADLETGSVIGSERWIAGELGISRSTLRKQLVVLEENGLIQTTPARNQHEQSLITIVDFDRLRGVEGAGPLTGPADANGSPPPQSTAAGTPAGSARGPADGVAGTPAGTPAGSERGPTDGSPPAALSPRPSRPSRSRSKTLEKELAPATDRAGALGTINDESIDWEERRRAQLGAFDERFGREIVDRP